MFNFLQAPLSPSEAWDRIKDGVSGTDIAWMLITMALIWIVYWICVLRNVKTTFNWQNVVLWFVTILGWMFSFVVFGRYRIWNNSTFAPLLFIFTSVITFLISVTLFSTNRIWYKIISNCIMAIVIFGMAITFAIGAQAYSYAIFFGSLLGIFAARLWQSVKYLNKPILTDNEEDDSILDNSEPTGI